MAYLRESDGDLYPAIVNRDERAFLLREQTYRAGHAAALRNSRSARRVDRGTWILERSYANHSHWLTAHLPKVLWLKQQDRLSDLLLPERRNATIDDSLRLLGLSAEEFPLYRAPETLLAGELTFFDTDRFRPELLRSVRDAFVPTPVSQPWRRVYISREGATRRRLVNEHEIWPLLRAAGFERVRMEALNLEEQITLMSETKWLCAPHGAGLTNMMFCNPDTQIVEIADLGFPNPNFYALASALGHGYWLVAAESVGDEHPLERDMRIAPARLRSVLRAID